MNHGHSMGKFFHLLNYFLLATTLQNTLLKPMHNQVYEGRPKLSKTVSRLYTIFNFKRVHEKEPHVYKTRVMFLCQIN